MTEPVNNKTLGGLTYNANLVKSARKVANKDKKPIYEIIFKSGEKITYPEQTPLKPDLEAGYNTPKDVEDPKAVTGESLNTRQTYFEKDETLPRNASITQHISGGVIYDDTTFDITNVMGAKFTSSGKTVTKVLLDNCSSTTVDLGANDSKWYGDTAIVSGGANNKVILDSNDSAWINQKRVKGEGTAAQKDY